MFAGDTSVVETSTRRGGLCYPPRSSHAIFKHFVINSDRSKAFVNRDKGPLPVDGGRASPWIWRAHCELGMVCGVRGNYPGESGFRRNEVRYPVFGSQERRSLHIQPCVRYRRRAPIHSLACLQYTLRAATQVVPSSVDSGVQFPSSAQ